MLCFLRALARAATPLTLAPPLYPLTPCFSACIGLHPLASPCIGLRPLASACIRLHLLHLPLGVGSGRVVGSVGRVGGSGRLGSVGRVGGSALPLPSPSALALRQRKQGIKHLAFFLICSQSIYTYHNRNKIYHLAFYTYQSHP
mgnify:CR=1 FL=1